VRVVVRALQQDLDLAKPPPGFTPQAWQAFLGPFQQRLIAVLREADPERQVDTWRQALVEWLDAVSRALRTEVDALALDAHTPPPAKQEFEKARARLDGIDALVAGNKVQDAIKAYDEAVKEYRAGMQVMPGTVQLGAPGGPAAPAPAPGTEIPPAVAQGTWNQTISVVLGAPTTVAQANLRLLAAEALLFLVLSAVALVIGLKLLYFDNAAWGSYTDMGVAFLWGFGLHQFAGNTFQSVQGLAQQVTGTR
jgi:hypothetical protein